MGELLQSVGRALLALLSSILGALQSIAWNPFTWSPQAWQAVASLGTFALTTAVFALLARERKLGMLERAPEVFIPDGEISEHEEETVVDIKDELGEVVKRSHATVIAYDLTLTLSNLSKYPIQVIEMAFYTDDKLPEVARVTPFVSPYASTTVSHRLTSMSGDEAWVAVYFYFGTAKERYYRLTAGVKQLPWAKKLKILPLHQTVEPWGDLASNEVDRVLEAEWERQYRYTPKDDSTAPRGRRRDQETHESEEKTPVPYDFPEDF